MNLKSPLYKINLPEKKMILTNKVEKFSIKAKLLKENVDIAIYFYNTNDKGMPDSNTVQYYFLPVEEMNKRELVFNFNKKLILTSTFFFQLEWLWPAGKTIEAAKLTFPYYGIGPMTADVIDENNKSPLKAIPVIKIVYQ